VLTPSPTATRGPSVGAQMLISRPSLTFTSIKRSSSPLATLCSWCRVAIPGFDSGEVLSLPQWQVRDGSYETGCEIIIFYAVSWSLVKGRCPVDSMYLVKLELPRQHHIQLFLLVPSIWSVFILGLSRYSLTFSCSKRRQSRGNSSICW
jgi:hypothetical protein